MSECCGSSRRDFLRRAAGSGAAAAVFPGVELLQRGKHPVPARKKLPASWGRDLLQEGDDRVLRGEAHRAVAMPVCGIGTGQLYLLPDGTLETWDIFNEARFTGYGRDNYGRGVPRVGIAQGFGLFVDGRFQPLSKLGFAETAFRGQWPIGRVTYVDEAYPLDVTLEAFSPFIPLDAAQSGLPATIFRLRLRNRTTRRVSGRIVAWLENASCLKSARRNGGCKLASLARVGKQARGTLWLRAARTRPTAGEALRPRITLADFDGKDWGEWRAEGDAFGAGPVAGELPQQQRVSGHAHKLANSFHGGDDATGTLTSPTFRIERRYINLLVGGGSYAKQTEVGLLVGGEVVHSATGRRSERLAWHSWNVARFEGREARIVVVDRRKGAWGHVLCDRIEQADEPRDAIEARPDFAELSLAGPRDPDQWAFDLPRSAEDARSLAAAALRQDGTLARATEDANASFPLEDRPIAAMSLPFELDAGAEESFPFVLTWFAPNHPYGRAYATRFHGSNDVAAWVLDQLSTLEGATRRFVTTYYDSTLPAWLLDRILWPQANLQTSLVQWRRGGRFWAWEGVGCCAGTCTHVWNYAQGLAALLPALERNIREYQDFGEGFDERSGLVGFRSNRRYAADGQCGTVLKAYREHLHAADDRFLRRNWPRIRMALEYMLRRDGDADGVIEDGQHNTYDIEFHGANTFVGALYLAALRAGEEMAKRMQDFAFAHLCRRVFAAGSERTMQRLWNGEYFVQEVDLGAHPKAQYGKGCLSDQLFGQNWAHQLALGYLYPRDAVRKALRAVHRYNWATDVGPYNEAHPPERVFANAGEPGLLTCTWPKSRFLPQGVRYKSEVWTGIEHQAASHMLREGLIQEGLQILRGIEARYDGRRHNPYNEVECGDHYARALAAWASLTALSGFELDGPAGRYRFDPRVTPERFKAFFAGPEGWGSYEQIRQEKTQVCRLVVAHGQLVLRELELPGMAGATTVEVHTQARDGGGRRGGLGPGSATERGTHRIRFDELVLQAHGHAVLEVRFS